MTDSSVRCLAVGSKNLCSIGKKKKKKISDA